jgi:hypothetical protein
MTYTIEQYQTERAICDAAYNYARETMTKRGKRCCYLTAEEAANPVYAACNNDMRGRVEQFEILRDMPEKFCAYLSDDCKSVQVWTGGALGLAYVLSSRPIGGYVSNRYYYGRAIINGQQYSWQGHGRGMLCRLRKIKGN